MKDLIKQIYKALYNEDLVQVVEKDCPVPPPPIKSNREKLYDFAITFLNTDPTPKDEQPDEYACVHSLTTILKLYLPDFPIMTYTPTFLTKLKGDSRFRPTNEFKEGNIIISPTGFGNGSVVGHTGIIGLNGEILSNSSATGLWSNKYTTLSWIDRYSRTGGLPVYLFELI